MSMKPDGSIHKGSATLGRRFKKFFTPPKADKTMPAPRIWPHESDPEEDLSFCIKRSPLDENIAKLQSAEKRVFVSLNFFNTTIQKKILSMLAGSATDLLNEVIDLFSELSHLSICPYSEQSSTLMSSHNQVYQSLAALIRWSDYLLIHDQINEDKACLNDITEAVKNGIKNLVKLSIQKLKDKDKESKKGPHSSNTLKVENSNRQHRTSLPEIPLSPKEKEILESTAPLSQSTDDLVVHTDDTPPPKPPLPNDRWSHPNILSDGNTIAVIPPDLPSKKRLSVPLITSASLTPPHSPQNLTKINGYPSPYDNIQRLHYGPHVRTINTGQPVVPNSTSFDNVDGDYADLDPSYSPQSVQHGSRKMHVVEESRYQMNQCSVEIKESSSCQMNRSSSCQIKQSSSYQSTMHSVQHSSFQSHGVVQAQTMNKNICQDPNSYNCTQQPDNNVTKETGKPIVRQISHYDNLNKLDVDGEPPPLPLKHTINTYLNVFKGYTEPATEQIQISQKRTYTTEMEAHYIEYFAPSPPPIPPKKRDSQEIGRLRPKTSPEKTTYWEAGNSDHKSHSMIETGACANLPAISSHQFNKENTALSGSDADRNESKSDTEEKTLDLLDVRHLLIPKKPTEDGPDVRGGSVEALIVHAAGAGKDFVFREAFLTTYRTFISPEELINKLLYRYPFQS
ncbi:rap guanine nucleotide exchange factor 1-like [Saccoglossus kowalevskii]|uniref:Rap guanine nucleotide exchange factor 1-like n=1 Tax=Saccoglossus kowalevskii TaxID=10224 RepID=A0ABM0LVN2_SACKO|nr:PREDICTED: rap guanine nucleotide exchange factor 1-like [Saccoglossus kowalevskii]